MISFTQVVLESLDEKKLGRVTKPKQGNYYNLKKQVVQGPRHGIGIERGIDGTLRASVVQKGVGQQRIIKKLPAKFHNGDRMTDRENAKEFGRKAARELGVNFYGMIPPNRDRNV